MYKPPFPWFGGKRLVADVVWAALGDVDNYVEPFFGSGAVLFNRPTEPRIETINDKDHWIANFWRAVQHAPDAVAEYADNPVNEDDLTARHIWLVKHAMPELAERIPADPEYYDAKVAGWWVWGICCWIGAGWCSGKGPWTEQDGQLVHLGNAGVGVNRKRVHLGDAGMGVNRQRQDLRRYFGEIADRLRFVRVCCGDWARVVTRGALTYGRTIGVFLDPPYSEKIRCGGIYNFDSCGIAVDVRRWCIENGDNPRYRIALCGYDGEHNELERLGWRMHAYSARPSYATHSSDNKNRHLERVWFSPNCIGSADKITSPMELTLDMALEAV